MPYREFTTPLTDSIHPLVFNSNATPTIGVELELQIVDAKTYALTSGILDLQKHIGADQDWIGSSRS